MIKVIVDGACGRMGKMLTSLVTRQSDMELVGATEYPSHPKIGVDVGEVAGIGSIGIKIVEDLTDVINYGDVVIEFDELLLCPRRQFPAALVLLLLPLLFCGFWRSIPSSQRSI